MNIKLLGIALLGTGLLMACGDTTGSGGGVGGGNGGSTGNEGGTGATGAGTSDGAGDVGGGGGEVGGAGGGTGDPCIDMYPDGAAEAGQYIDTYCGCIDEASSPCFADCVDDEACGDTPGPQPSTAPCGECIQGEIDQGAASDCVSAAAFGPECSASEDCTAFIGCEAA